jgi:hypothetical protein
MAKGSKKKTSAANTRYFSGYNAEKQRKARLERHLKKHPNDAQAKKAKPTYRRKKPETKLGWLTRQVAANIYIGFTPGRNDDPVNIVNGLSPLNKVKTAQAAKTLRKIRNRLEYQKEDKSKSKLGYAG